jgi:molybdopterin molybdotransferase
MMEKGFRELKNVDEALNIVMKIFGSKNFEKEELKLSEALDRVLAEDIISDIDIPPFDRAAVDGFALKSYETFSANPYNPAVFKIKGIIEAGVENEEIEVREGECYAIYTGAPIPKGADAVVMVEDCDFNENFVKVKKSVAKFTNISLKGEDIKKGEIIMRKGQLIRPWHIGVLSSIGRKKVIVYRLPIIGVVSIGDELVDYEDKLTKGKIIDSTRPMIISLLREIGCNVIDKGIIRDDYNEILNSLSELSNNVDMIITIGGTSLGGKDLVPKVIKDIVFHGLAIKPGKPTGFGIFNEKPVLMLPGYPVSALVGFECIGMPLLSHWRGKKIERKKIKAILSRRVPITPGIRHFLRVSLKKIDNKLIAEPIALTGSGLLSSITKADGIIIIKENIEGLEEGEEVEVEIL